MTAHLHLLTRLRMGGSTPLVFFYASMVRNFTFHLSLVLTLIKLNVFNSNVNNSIKMGTQKHMEMCSILCFLIYQSLLQYSNYLQIIYLIYVFFLMDLSYMFQGVVNQPQGALHVTCLKISAFYKVVRLVVFRK